MYCNFAQLFCPIAKVILVCTLLLFPCRQSVSRARHVEKLEQYVFLQDLYDFVFSHPQSPEEFEITTNFPKRVVARGASHLSDVGLKDRDVLFVNDVNA